MNGFTLGADAGGATEWANITASEILLRSAADAALQLRIAQYLIRKWRIPT